MKFLSWVSGAFKLLACLAPFIRGLIEAFETPGFGSEKKAQVMAAVKESLDKLEVPSVVQAFIMWIADLLVDRIVGHLNEAGTFEHQEA